MISMNSTLSRPPLKPGDVQTFSQFLAVLESLTVDPAGARARLNELSASIVEAQNATAAAKAEREQLDVVRAEQQGKLDAAQQEHDRRLAAERSQFEEKCAGRERALGEREAAMKEAEDKLRAETEAVASLHADLDRRINAIRAAAS